MTVSQHWDADPTTGAPTCACTEFHCPYATPPAKRCGSECDCFIDTYPDSPFALHPEAFVVGRPAEGN